MKAIKSKLALLSGKTEQIFFDTSAHGRVKLGFSDKVSADFVFSDGSPVSCRKSTESNGIRYAEAEFSHAGVYRLDIRSDNEKPITIEIEADDDVIPFILPGLGIVPSHGDETALLLAANEAHELYSLSDCSTPGYFVPIIRGIPEGEYAAFSTCEAEPTALQADWYPKLGRAFSWHSTELFTDAECIKCSLSPSPNNVRYTIFGSSVTALCKPTRPLRLGKLKLEAFDNGKPIDARFSFFIGESRVAMLDVMRDEKPTVLLPEGHYRVEVSHGFRFEVRELEVNVSSGELGSISAELRELFALPHGRVTGELHIHSAFEDATAFPTQVMRAARACGSSFCFQTDKDITELLAYPLERLNVTADDPADSFLALRGQEIMCQELHMNILNTDRQFPNPEADNLSRINPDITDKIAAWLDEFKQMKSTRPCLLMHNHPSHRPEVQKNAGYFRSWWVSDRFDGFNLVENFDTRTWYDRLNRGNVQFGAWTTDSHDCTLIPPGEECVCVYVGDKLDENSLIAALEAGRFYFMRTPGLFMDFRAESGEPLKLRLHIESPRPIRSIEWVVNGRTARVDSFAESDAPTQYDGELPPASDAVWCHVKVALYENVKLRDKHTTTPLMVEGFAAYSNPIFIGRGE